MKKPVLSKRTQGCNKSVAAQRRYRTMSDAELKVAARKIVTSSYSEAEVQWRLRKELGYPHQIFLTVILDAAIEGEVRKLAKNLKGLVMKSGAKAVGIMRGHNDFICF